MASRLASLQASASTFSVVGVRVSKYTSNRRHVNPGTHKLRLTDREIHVVELLFDRTLAGSFLFHLRFAPHTRENEKRGRESWPLFHPTFFVLY